MPRRDGAVCSQCLFFQNIEGIGYGECRSNAPKPGDSHDFQWPQVYRHDWCGEWEWSGATDEEAARGGDLDEDRDPGEVG